MRNLSSIINTKDENGNFVLNKDLQLSLFEPFISKETVYFHYYRHLSNYIDKVNDLKNTDDTIENIILKEKSGPLYNNASQVYNHYFYFDQFNINGSHKPFNNISNLINDQFGSFENFQKDFINTGLNVFGSGWVFLVLETNSLKIKSYIGTGTPLTNCKPLIALDVWEHAYYLDHFNNRENYIKSFFKIIDWEIIENRLL